MTQAELKILLNKYTEGTLSTEEQVRLDQWYLYQAKNGKSLTDATIYEKRMRELNEALFPAQDEEPKRIRLWPRIAVAAAAVAAITLGIWMYYTPSSRKSPSSRTEGRDLYTNDIAPGKNTATLTLANGKTILLDTNRTSVVVADSVHTMTMLTAATPRGGTYQLVLPDGTKVWLNADSRLEFPSNFVNSKTRNVKLSGEGYFEVAKNKAQPFIVAMDKQEIEVLGTHFNVNAYADEGSIKTTLLEGSVSVRPAANTPAQAIVLKPQQQSILSGSSQIQVKEVDVEDVVAWQKGYFLFEHEHIKDVMRKIARWYDVEVIYEGNTENVLVGGTVSRFSNVSKVLGMLQETGAVKFRIAGRKVYVYR